LLSFYFYSLTQATVATAVTLNYTSPMFLALVTVLWYRERVRPQISVAILLGFAGVILCCALPSALASCRRDCSTYFGFLLPLPI
jgi:drug/metabolite transporter (DMT)-like permease